MDSGLGILVVLLFMAGVYLVTSARLVQVIVGMSLLTHATNLMLLVVSGAPEGKSAPLITLEGPWVDPLPQALILTAIVIGFGIGTFVVVLFSRLARIPEDEPVVPSS